MRNLAFILGIILAQAYTSPAQIPVDVQRDSLRNTQYKLKAKHVDSMVSYVRKQFYGNNFDIIIEVGEQTLKEANEIHNLKAVVTLSSLIGNAFMKLDDTLQAKRIFADAIKMAEKEHDSTKISITAQIDLGNYYALQEKSKQAIPIYQKAIPLSKKLGDTTHLYILNYNIAELFLNDKEPEHASYYVDETNKYVQSLKPDAYHAGAKLLTGKLFFQRELYRQAIEILNASIQLSETSGFMDGLIEGYDYLARSYAAIGESRSAYDAMQLLDSYKAEKYKSDKIEAIEYATAKYKLNQYQQELKAQALQNEITQQEAKRETTIFWIKIAVTILVVFSIFLFISYRKRKQLLVHLIEKNKQYLQAKEYSEELAKAKSILFSNITHELRTPMYGIIGISSLLMRDKKLKDYKENISSLKFSANHLLSLINNVLQLTNIYATRKEELKRNRFSIRELINNIVRSSEFINPTHPNTYKIHIDKNIPEYLIGDEMKISQVLINLIGNASKFTHNGIIDIDVKRQADLEGKICLNFNIKDTGIGISEEKQATIFNEFAQIAENDEHHGTGLGLPIVKKILNLYESDLELKSEVGKGTEVSFKLCYEAAEEIVVAKNGVKTYPKDHFKGKHILVVDDNKINQLVTKKVLVGYGAKVSVAGGGAEAINLAGQDSFDLILMDINMPEINGFEATKAIREFDTQIPIVALTAVEMEKLTGENSFNLMNGCIIKPYKNEFFLDTISKHIFKVIELQIR